MYYCYTDGGCRVSEHTPGGWGVYIRTPQGEEMESYGGAIDTTSSVMELAAVKAALELLPRNAKATVFSDSQEIISYCEKSLPIWRQNGWKNLPKLLEKDLLAVESLLTDKELVITWKWIRSHNGNAGNERADHLANLGARDAKSEIQKMRKK